MSNNEEERRVKTRHDVTHFYQRRSVKRTSSRQNLPRGDMSVSSDPSPDNSNISSDDDVEDDTYMPSPRAHPHGKGLASASGSGAAREEEIEEEEDGNDGTDGDDGEEEGEVFDVEKSTLKTKLTWDLLCSGCPQTLHGGLRFAIRARLSL
jgi:hypothetical protein